MGLFDRFVRRGKKDEGRSRPLPPEPSTPPPEWAAFFRTGERYERFEDVVRSYFKDRGKRALILDGAAHVTGTPGSSGSSGIAYGLGNVAQVCALEPEARWPAIVSLHFDIAGRASVTATDVFTLSLESARPRLCVRLWDMTTEVIRERSIWREDIPGLATVLCLDEPESIRSLRIEAVEHWGLSPEELFEIARANVSSLAPVQHQQIDLGGDHRLHELLGESFFSCAWALRLEEWPALVGAQGMFFSVPGRHRILAMPFVGIGTMEVLGKFIAITHGLYTDGPGSISSRIYWRHDGETMEIPCGIEEGAPRITPPDRFIDHLNELAEREGPGAVT